MKAETSEPFVLFLIGDTGELKTDGNDAVFNLLKEHFPSTTNSMIIFLGDLVYPNGLPPENHSLRKHAEKVLTFYHSFLKDFKGEKRFISGNHDWNKGKPNGYEYVLRQENYLTNLFNDKTIYQPSSGCPGPILINSSGHIAIIAINTQWWLQDGFKPAGKQFGCSANNEQEFFAELNNLLFTHREKKIIVVGHTPIYSYSMHGGRYKFRHHLFPLTVYRKNAWLPLPLIGSLLPLYRRLYGAREDITHPRYRRLRAELKLIFSQYPGLIYACGHEHNLQHITKNGNHFIVSGSGSKVKYVVDSGKHLNFGVDKRGFFKLTFFDKKIVCECFVIKSNYLPSECIYRVELN
ncbi:metallophosphoesterase [Solitalea sp. MAHUQ-68]|uniref:Metallophosphoesterase n=1 Tax=Solitalea agri TaxID=2953739 RepID=A0A9X2F3W6_9SPHI|nr:metallophosphoesterase [Solitalea agri]MCO4293760.1 metallophosphoesterase [Solitalea agri]